MEEEQPEEDSGRITLPEGIIAQHGHLRHRIRRLRRAHESGRSWEDLAVFVDELLADVRGHFQAEETVMEISRYPRLGEHRNQHRTFMKRLEALRIECDHKETELMSVLTEILESWFKTHEATADKDALDFMGIEI
jgi:hemerythrin-like metal-binding protein